jgi:ribosomal protein S18 acetylase RimI-like enzyme
MRLTRLQKSCEWSALAVSLFALLLTGCTQTTAMFDARRGLVRDAQEADLEQIETLAQDRRVRDEKAQPVYFHQAAGARDKHLLYLRDQMELGKQMMLVHTTFGNIDGFLMANAVTPPPIYDPGGKTLMIDDFVVWVPERWRFIGSSLLDEAERRAKSMGVVQIVAVCGEADDAKKKFLSDEGLSIASSWFTRPIK